MSARTLEERLKFDHGLVVGRRHLVRFTLGAAERDALVEIKRRRVYILVKPREGDMYSAWHRVSGDALAGIRGGVIVWGARDPSMMAMFDGEPAARVALKVAA